MTIRTVLHRLALTTIAFAATGCHSSRNSGPPAGSPAAPSDLTAGLKDLTEAVLNWVDNSDDETSFEIYKIGGGEDLHLLTSVPANSTHYTDDTNRSSSVYYYLVTAKNDRGESAASNTVELKTWTPNFGGGGSCGIIISDPGIGITATRAVGPENQTPGNLCLFGVNEGIQVEDVEPLPSTGRQVTLRGRQNDAVAARVTRVESGDSLRFEIRTMWSNPPPSENWELCFAIHDATRGDLRATVEQHGVSQWTPRMVTFPVLGRLPIQPDRWYDFRVTIDRRRGRYSVHLDGMTLATDVALDRILVGPAVVMRPQGIGGG